MERAKTNCVSLTLNALDFYAFFLNLSAQSLIVLTEDVIIYLFILKKGHKYIVSFSKRRDSFLNTTEGQ